ncbi:hypothetical protein, partial [Halorubrum sp. GN11GM_10-3_MGM]|uniref:hypothetical protein n=1 Tax=Halorubrum sp. GN11GM_10-3_MGM TaxID=2518111 RepID=UPI001A7E1BF8
RRLREESIEIILAEVTDDLFTAIPRHSYTSNSTFITSTRHYEALDTPVDRFVGDFDLAL